MADSIREPDANDSVSEARRSGHWLMYHRNALRLVLALLVLGFLLWGLLGSNADGFSPAIGTAIALAITWGIGEIAWFLVDRATPDPIGTPPGDEREDLTR